MPCVTTARASFELTAGDVPVQGHLRQHAQMGDKEIPDNIKDLIVRLHNGETLQPSEQSLLISWLELNWEWVKDDPWYQTTDTIAA